MAAPLGPDVVAKIDLLLAAGVWNVRDIQVALRNQGLRVGHVAIGRRKEKWTGEAEGEGAPAEVRVSPDTAHPDEHVTFEEAGDEGRLACVTREEVRTEDDLVRVCKIDLSRWRVARMRVKAYQASMKLEAREVRDSGGRRIVAHRPHTVQLFSVSADLERVLPRAYLEAADALFERLSRGAPEFPPPPPCGGPYLATMGLFDVHFAKLCWGRETGRGDYDLRLAELVYRNAGHDLLQLLSPYPVGRFIVPVGQDIFHIDTARNTTTAGTIVDTDGRYPKMIEVGSAAVIWLIDLLQAAAPVDVVHVPGNHDKLSSYHLCREIKAHFRNAPGVSVDIGPSTRKYRRYGQCLFGYRHGDNLAESQVSSLPGLMADEMPREWGETTCRAWFLGHKHTSKRYTTRESDEIRGTRMHWLSALSGTDAWHHEFGFVGNTQAAETYLHSDETGYRGHFIAPARY